MANPNTFPIVKYSSIVNNVQNNKWDPANMKRAISTVKKKEDGLFSSAEGF